MSIFPQWKAWDALPENLRCAAVRPYYDLLAKRRASLVLKRLFDLLLAVLLLAALWPVYLVIAALIALDSPGGILFRQERVTTYGAPFRICKFRTMRSDASRANIQVTLPGDSRVTRVGKFLRKAKLDELPQLFNILGGTMSFVGTRPEVPKYVARYSDEMRATLLLPAGITSEGSIFSIGENELLEGAPDLDEAYVRKVLPEKMKYNLAAMRHFSFYHELRTMVRTVLAVVGAPIHADEYGA